MTREVRELRREISDLKLENSSSKLQICQKDELNKVQVEKGINTENVQNNSKKLKH